MRLVRFKNIPAVIGLSWHALPPDQPERRAIKSVLEQHKGAKAGVVVKFGGVTLFGLGPVGAKVISGPSAAAWLALANQKAMDQNPGTGLPNTGSGSANDWIVIENLGDGTFWLAIIRDGVPLPGADAILDRETALEYMREAIETVPFIVYSADEGIRNDVPAGTLVEARGFADLVQGVKPGKAAMRTVSGVSTNALLIIGGIVLLGVAFLGYSLYAEKQKQKQLIAQSALQAQQQQKQLAADKADYAQKVRLAVLAALEKGEQDVNATLATPSPADAIGTWVGMISDVSANHNGWDLTGFTCENSTEGPVCTVSLRRTDLGTNRILLQDHPDAVLDGDTATYQIKGATPALRSTTIRDLERAASFNLEFVSDLQMLHFADVSYSLGTSTDVTSPVNMPSVPASLFKPGDAKQGAPAPGPVKMGVGTGELTFTGKDLWQLEGLREFLLRNNVVVKTVEVGVSGISPGNWTLKGNYYFKNAPEPILPVVVGPDKEMIQVQLPEKYRATPEELATWQPAGPVAAAASAPKAEAPAGSGPLPTGSAPASPAPTGNEAPTPPQG